VIPAEPADFRLLESIRWDPDEGFLLLDEHLARMRRSAGALGFQYAAVAARERLGAAVADVTAAVKLRLLLGPRGAVDVECQPLPWSPGPVRVRVAGEPVLSSDPRLFHKTTDRGVYDQRLAAHPDCDDVLLVNERGELTESTIANLVLEIDGVRWTPPLDAGLLPGVFREAMLRDGVIRERTLRVPDLRRADAVFLINSVRRWRPATVIR